MAFQDVLNDITNGVAALGQVAPTISANGIASVQSISAILASAGAAAASSTKDQNTQNEIIASTQTALVALPLIWQLFHHKASQK